MIRKIETKDFEAVAEIYNYYILNTVVTFEETEVDSDEIGKRVRKVNDLGFPWLVAVDNECVVGYAYATKWNERSAYKHSCEVTVYLKENCRSKGWGTKLYSDLFAHLPLENSHAVLAGITLPNSLSVALHEKYGMQKVAHFSEVGYKFGQWLDVGYWQIKKIPNK